MMFRRQQFDRVNPRHVAPSRHTIFVRGLPGHTDVTKVKEFFSNESNSKCSVDFFSTSDDRKRLSIAVRFKSHDIAKELLNKYNNKMLMGFPVELTWFKDLKKARAKMFEEQRQSGGRQFQRSGFRDNRGGANYPDGGHRMRAGSSSSDGGQVNRSRYSRSRSFTGSSSRSASRSYSPSPRARRANHSNDPNSLNDRTTGRNHSFRSGSRSSSSSRSSAGARIRRRSNSGQTRSNQNVSGSNFTRDNNAHSPVSFNSHRTKPLSGSPSSNAPDYTSFANAPAPDVEGGSSLVSGLIQLKRRGQPDSQETRFSRRDRRASPESSSGFSANSPRLARDNDRKRVAGKRLPSLSPSLTRSQPVIKSRSELSPESRPAAAPSTTVTNELTDLGARKRPRRVSRSPDSLSPPVIRTSYRNSSKTDQTSSRPRSPSMDRPIETQSNHHRDISAKSDRQSSGFNQTQEVNKDWSRSRKDTTSSGDRQWPSSKKDASDNEEGWRKSRQKVGTKSGRGIYDSLGDESSFSGDDNKRDLPKRTEVNEAKENNAILSEEVENIQKPVLDRRSEDPLERIRQRKDTIAEDYKRDCEAFTVVIRTLISKDSELESRLMPMLKDILDELGQRRIEELRTFVANNPPEVESKMDYEESQNS